MTRKKLKKKIEIENVEETKSDIIFCTECGDVLEDFSVSDDAKDLKSVIENFHNCKKIGRFKGEICSKLYMISPPTEENE